MRVQPPQHLAPRNHALLRPVRGPADIHVFDEAHLGPARPAELDQVHQFIVVDAADDDSVDLEAGEDRRRGGDPLEHAIELVESRQAAEPFGMQRVEADGQAVQTGVAQRPRLRREQDAVGRHRQVANGGARGEPADQIGQVAAQQRLASGQPHLVDAERGEDVDQRLDFLEVQDVFARQPDVVRLRHAVAAAQVAAIRHRQAQVPQRAMVGVEEH